MWTIEFIFLPSSYIPIHGGDNKPQICFDQLSGINMHHDAVRNGIGKTPHKDLEHIHQNYSMVC